MRILLIEPSKISTDAKLRQFDLERYTNPHLGLLSIASEIIKLGHYAEYFSVNRADEKNGIYREISQKIKNFDIVGISTTSFTIEEDANLAFFIRTQMPNILIIFGGYFAWDKPLETLKFTEADIVIRGHGEQPIKEFLKLGIRRTGINDNIKELQNIHGICFKYKPKGKEKYHISQPFVHDENTIKNILCPSFGIFPWENYNLHNYVFLYTSKGCPYSCKFCSVPRFDGKKVITLKEEIIEKQILELTKIGCKYLYIADPDFNVKKEHVIKVCNLIIKLKGENKITKNTNFICQARIDLLDIEELEKMKQAGFGKICFGIESISKNIIVNDVKKSLKINPEEIFDKLKLVKEYGIVPLCYFILGLPETQPHHLKENLNFIRIFKENGFDVEIEMFVVPFFETTYYKEYPRNVRYRTIKFIRFDDGLIKITPFRIPRFLIPKNKEVYGEILKLRNEAIKLRKEKGIIYEEAAAQIICENKDTTYTE